MQIVFSDEPGRLTPEMQRLMEQAAEEAFRTEFGKEAGIESLENDPERGVTVVDDNTIRELNRDYRGNDSVTDVLSFPQFEGHADLLADLMNDEASTLIGDVVICFEQAERQAEEYGTGMTREMLYLFVHSVMHLFGYDHMEEDEKAVMRAREEEVLAAIGVSRGK